ncbi:uncharacterized protein [Montipora foliosa]|uniref:uncharacterized protein n=1 Tax=Montipora foliosa TaxID=591990 RepID=UPI0035F1E133
MMGCYFSVRGLAILFWLWLACVENKTYAVRDLTYSDCKRSVKFLPPREGHRLKGHVFRNFTIDKYAIPCEQECVMDRKCVSINIGPTMEDKTICELSDSDHYQHPEDLESNSRWKYRFTENPCNSSICLNGGKCFMGYTDKKYVCECLPGSTGEHCEKVHPRVSLSPGPLYAIEGSNVTFPTCNVTGQPPPKVIWKNATVQLSKSWRVWYNDSLMQIFQVRKEDSGFYSCSAKNILGSVEKKTSLVVVSPLQFTVKPPSKIVGILGCNMTLNCSATGGPKPTVIWRKQGGQIPVGRRLQINGALVLTNLTLNDTGNYSCVITSAILFQEIETVTSLEVNENGTMCSSNILGDLDAKYHVKLRSFLAPVLHSSSRSRFVRCWRAKTDGWAASTFHSNCDGKGPSVTIIEVGSYIFGGYTDISWSSPPSGSCAYASSNKSFIYSLYNINGYAPVKLQVNSARKNDAIYRCSIYGPTFGRGHDIRISNNAASDRNSNTHCGGSYPLPPGYYLSGFSCTFYAGSFKFTPTDIEVFYETTT